MCQVPLLVATRKTSSTDALTGSITSTKNIIKRCTYFYTDSRLIVVLLFHNKASLVSRTIAVPCGIWLAKVVSIISYIVLSQRLIQKSTYKDEPFRRYHFPGRYRNQVKPGDFFLYYQGKSGPNRRHRYYFGVGVVGAVYPDIEEPDHYYAEVADAQSFSATVPIYAPGGGYYESIGFEEVRNKPIPAWENSIRRISTAAFEAIVAAAGAQLVLEPIAEIAELDKEKDWVQVLKRLNERYNGTAPAKRQTLVERYLDRGIAVTRVLKQILGPVCQICGVRGFPTRSKEWYIEAHHLTEVSQRLPNSLCSENIILVCPTCHRKLHHARYTCEPSEMSICVSMLGEKVTIPRNTIAYLTDRLPTVTFVQPTAQEMGGADDAHLRSTRAKLTVLEKKP